MLDRTGESSVRIQDKQVIRPAECGALVDCCGKAAVFGIGYISNGRISGDDGGGTIGRAVIDDNDFGYARSHAGLEASADDRF